MRVLLIVITFIVAASGCSNNNNGASSSPNNNQQFHVQQSTPNTPQMTNNSDVVERLEKLAEAVPDVKNAHCVVIGKTAVVGINVAGNLERARVGSIKYSVAEALRKDPVGINAIVTADIDIGNRIREMSRDIKNGQPISGLTDELADIIGRIIPQLPKDVDAPGDNRTNQNQTNQTKRLNQSTK